MKIQVFLVVICLYKTIEHTQLEYVVSTPLCCDSICLEVRIQSCELSSLSNIGVTQMLWAVWITRGSDFFYCIFSVVYVYSKDHMYGYMNYLKYLGFELLYFTRHTILKNNW
jgi:hypothetical protein